MIGSPIADCCGGLGGHGASYLGPQHDGVQLSVDPKNPLPFATPARDVYREEQAGEFELLGRLNRLSADEYPDDPALRARIKSYELAFRMQTAVPEVMQLSSEPAATQTLLRPGPRGDPWTSARCAFRRGGWSSVGCDSCRSSTVQRRCRRAGTLTAGCGRTTPPSAPRSTGRLRVCSRISSSAECSTRRSSSGRTEFGRTPGSEGKDGRDHHPYGFSVWMAGGGIKGGVVHGATDEIGYHAVEDRHYVTDIHATSAAPARPRSAPARGPGSEAPGNRFRPRYSRHPRVIPSDFSAAVAIMIRDRRFVVPVSLASCRDLVDAARQAG